MQPATVMKNITWKAPGAIDTVAPTVAIGVPEKVNGPFALTFEFSEEVEGFSSAGITSTNAGVTDFQSVSASVYTATVTPGLGGTFTISVLKDAARDRGGNGNAAVSASGTYALAAPSLTISGIPAATNDSPLTATFEFSVPVTGFEAGDVTTVNATVSNFTGSGASYSARVTHLFRKAPLRFRWLRMRRRMRKSQGSVSASARGIYDITPPVYTLDVPALTAGPFTVTVRATEPPDEVFPWFFANTTNLTLTGFTSSSDGDAWVGEIEAVPQAVGPFQITLGARIASDAAGNYMAEVSAQGVYDPSPPVLTITSPTKTSGAFTAGLTFSEVVSGFTVEDVVVANAILSDFAGSGADYTVRVTPLLDGPFRISVAENAAQDAVGNGSEAAQAQGSYDSEAPTLTITGVPAQADQAFTVTFTFSEAVSGFEARTSRQATRR